MNHHMLWSTNQSPKFLILINNPKKAIQSNPKYFLHVTIETPMQISASKKGK